MKIKGHISKMVFNLLRDDAESRDDWMLMIKKVHDIEMQYFSITKEDFYDNFFNNKFSNVDTIKRLWAFLQEKFPELRGEQWNDRQIQGGQIAHDIANGGYQLLLF